jgi:cysteine desulfurase
LISTEVGLDAATLIFSSGATESLNSILRSFVGFENWNQKSIVTCLTEHDAVLAPSRCLAEKTAVALHSIQSDKQGRVDLEVLRTIVEKETHALVAVMAANNEIGTIHPVRDIANIAHEAGALFLCDLTQAMGKMPVDMEADGIDIGAFSAHKMYGPKGVGALVIRNTNPPIELEPLILGGGQERGLRGGTLNVPGIVGFGEACRIAREEMATDIPRMQRLRDKLETTLLAELPDIWINGSGAPRLCNTSNIGFKGVDARTLIRDMHDIAVSTKSACSSGDSRPSHVLKAIGLSDEAAYSCIRFSLGRFTTEQEIDYAIGKVVESVRKLRRNLSA